MFWPMAIVNDTTLKSSYTLYTHEGCLSIEKAKEVIETWKSNNTLQVLCAYITDSNTSQVVYLENNLDVLGNIRYKSEQNEKTIDFVNSLRALLSALLFCNNTIFN